MTLAADHEVFPTPQLQVGDDVSSVAQVIASHADRHVFTLSKNSLNMISLARKLTMQLGGHLNTPRQHRQFVNLVSQSRQQAIVLGSLVAVSMEARQVQGQALLACSELQADESGNWILQQQTSTIVSGRVTQY